MLKMISVVVLAFIHISSAAVSTGKLTIECPVINCDTTIGEMICYEHSNDVPVSSINTFFCPEDRVCNLQKDKFSWVTSKLQDIDTTKQNKQNSQVYKRLTSKGCDLIDDKIKKNLEAGREADNERRCKSGAIKN
jgi:predicted transcriptional regulator